MMKFLGPYTVLGNFSISSMKFLGQTSVQKIFSTSLIRKAVMLLLCLPIAHFALAGKAFASEVEIVVSSNGAGSDNQANVSSQNTTTVNQTNNANINNNVNTNSNTGGNSASSNSGDATVATGNTSLTTSISNNNINTNSASTNSCCNGDTHVSVNGNGALSDNSVYFSSNTTTVLNQNNTATINNNITVKANTGGNKAKYNGGDVTIVTGKIYSSVVILNNNINKNEGELLSGMGGLSSVIKGNGAYSDNDINFSQANNITINKDNEANINNNVYEVLNTGNNYAVGNLGDVVIKTGDIESFVRIENENINSNKTVVSCECKEKPHESQPTPQPHFPSTSLVQGASGSSSSQGAAAGQNLPKTGVSFSSLYILTLILFMMFVSGLYLRFHSSHAPPTVA